MNASGHSPTGGIAAAMSRPAAIASAGAGDRVIDRVRAPAGSGFWAALGPSRHDRHQAELSRCGSLARRGGPQRGAGLAALVDAGRDAETPQGGAGDGDTGRVGGQRGLDPRRPGRDGRRRTGGTIGATG